MISVVIPLYNKEKQIAKTLRSVLQQSFQNFEIVGVNDGSTDRSVEEVVKIHDSRLILVHQSNAGVSAARNKGIELAKGEFVAFLDADDEWDIDYLETQINLTKKYPQCAVYATNYSCRNSKGVVTNTIIKKLPFEGVDGVLSNYFEVASSSNPPLWTSAVMVRKFAIQFVGGFPLGIKSGEDLLTWARLAVHFSIAYSKKILTTFIFDQAIFNEDQKKRKPELTDLVGKCLVSLYEENKKVVGLKSYLALWYKMRSRIYLEKGYRFLCFREALRSMQYKITFKILVFVFLCCFPKFVIRKIFQ